MPSTYSDLKLQLMATGENSTTWGNITNLNLTALEEAVTGTATVTFASADVTLTLTNSNSPQTARNLRLNLTGTTGGARNLIVPAIEKVYLISNGTADTVTVKNSTGTGIAVPAGKTMWVFNNATNVVDATTHLTSLTLGSPLPVASGGTGANTASAARTNLGATTVGGNFFTLANPSADTFIQINADNTVSALDAAAFRSAIGAGSSNASGTVTSVNINGSTTGLTFSGGPITTTGTFTVGGTLAVANGGTGSNTASGARTNLGLGSLATLSSINNSNWSGDVLVAANGGTGLNAVGTSGNVLTSNGTTWVSQAPATSGGTVTSVNGSGGSSGLTLSGGPITTSGTLTIGGTLAVSSGGTGSITASGARTNLGVTATGADTTYAYRANNLSDLASASTARTNLGLGSLATLSSINNSNWSGTVLSVANGGTGSNTAADARTALSVPQGFSNSATPFNTAVGYQAGNATTSNATQNTFIGYQAGLLNSDGDFNTLIGYQAGDSITTGGSNTAVGNAALGALSTNGGNTAIGATALSNCTGGNNTAVGVGAGGMTTGTNNTVMGYFAFGGTTGNNNTVIGYFASSSTTSVSNEITLGDANITALRCQVTTITSLSDARDKADVRTLDAGLEFIKAVEPVRFTWNMRDGGKVGEEDTGFIAQQLKVVQQATGVTIPGLVYESNPEKLEAGYGKLVPVLVKAIQELAAKVEALEAQLGV